MQITSSWKKKWNKDKAEQKILEMCRLSFILTIKDDEINTENTRDADISSM